jgi:V8-like Glu-specific endopeptidase
MANRWDHGWGPTDRATVHAFEQSLLGGVAMEDYGETPIGTDDRVQVQSAPAHPSTRLFPFNSICMIRTPTGGIATGTLIAPQVVLTAGHVLRNKRSITITPGADLSAATDAARRPASPPAQTVPSSRFRLHPSLDVGLALAPSAFTRPSQFMMLQPRSDANTAALLTNAGYPGGSDPPPGWSLGTMWRHSQHIAVTDISPTHLIYELDTSPGHSGSPLWLLGNGDDRLLLGVHTSGVSSSRPNHNRGVRITGAVIAWIEEQCRVAGVTGPRVERGLARSGALVSKGVVGVP